MAIVVDIECVAVEGVSALYDAPEPDKRLKDPDKIAADIAQKRVDQIARAALYPWTARVVALGYCEDGDEAVRVFCAANEATETVMLKEFWAMAWNGHSVAPLVTFNGLAYDLPVLAARSRLLGISAPELNLDRYRSPHPDLMQILTFRGAIERRSLKFFAKVFGLNTDDAFSGKEIAELYEDQNWMAIKAHCESDVTLTRQLAEHLGVIKRVRRVA